MGWWDSVTEKTKGVGNSLLSGAQWILSRPFLTSTAKTVFTFTANTSFHVLEEALAAKEAVPALWNNPEARKVVSGMGYLIVHDVVPIVGLHYINNGVQDYFHEDDESQAQASFLYSIFLSAVTFGGYVVTAYTWQQGAQTLVRVAVLDAVALPAFNAHKRDNPPHSLCDEDQYHCNERRKLKGMTRELGILWANDVLIGIIAYLSLAYMSTEDSLIAKALIVGNQGLTLINNGRYIARCVTPERCERHKFMEQEFVLAVGLAYQLSIWSMDQGLQKSMGPLPFLYLRALHHMMLALHVNLAAHMKVPLVEPKDATLTLDLFNYYERACRFILDVFWAGLLKRVPIDFKPEPGAAPFIPLSSVLKGLTRVFNSDLERANTMISESHLKRTLKAALLPPMFRSAYEFPRDPIIAPYWVGIRSGAIAAVDVVGSYGKTPLVAALAKAPKSVAVALDLKFGIPEELTQIVLHLSKKDDFWALTAAIKAWFERHNVEVDASLAPPTTPLGLHGDKELIASPITPSAVIPTAVQLDPTVSRRESVADPQALRPRRGSLDEGLRVSTAAAALFSTRRPPPGTSAAVTLTPNQGSVGVAEAALM